MAEVLSSETLPSLTINKLSHETFNELSSNNQLNDNELYFVQSDNIDAGGDVIINIGDAQNETDAVNLRTLLSALNSTSSSVMDSVYLKYVPLSGNATIANTLSANKIILNNNADGNDLRVRYIRGSSINNGTISQAGLLLNYTSNTITSADYLGSSVANGHGVYIGGDSTSALAIRFAELAGVSSIISNNIGTTSGNLNTVSSNLNTVSSNLNTAVAALCNNKADKTQLLTGLTTSDKTSLGISANGSYSGTAIGYNANGCTCGTAIGANANGSSAGTAIGYNAEALSGRVAIGYQAAASETSPIVIRSVNASILCKDSAKLEVTNTNKLKIGGCTMARLTDIPAAITIDSTLCTTSTNPVQNKVIKTALDSKADKTKLLTGLTTSHNISLGMGADGAGNGTAIGINANGSYSGTAIGYNANGSCSGTAIGYNAEALSGRVAIGTNATASATSPIVIRSFDATTCKESAKLEVTNTNKLKIGGCTMARLTDIPSAITIDSTLCTTSTNPVQNKVITSALNCKADKTQLCNKADKTQLCNKADKTQLLTGSTTNNNTSLGIGANGSSYGIAIGYCANGDNGTAVGYCANGSNCGTAVGLAANGSYNGTAIGYNANGSYNGTAIGSYTEALSGRVAIGFGATASNTSPIIIRSYDVTTRNDSAKLEVTNANKLKIGGCTMARLTDIPSVDSALSTTSTNPVQNKVIKSALDSKADKADIPAAVIIDSAVNDNSTNPVQNKVIKAYVDGLIGDINSLLDTI